MMRTKTKAGLKLVTVAAVLTVAFGTVAPAYAEPAAGFPDLVGVGSDTTQDVLNGLAAVSPGGGISAIGSYNATGTATIQTRATGNVLFDRPNGSGSGVNALSASANGSASALSVFPSGSGVSITGQVDFARSSSAPSSSFVGTDLTFIPFALDAVTFAVSAASDFPRDIALGAASQDSLLPRPFTLRNIYLGNVTRYSDRDFNSITIQPIIPQTGSGTRSFWLKELGLTEAAIVGTPTTDLNNTAQEHDGRFVTGMGDIMPFSIAQFIAQGNHRALPTTILERRGNVELGRVGTVKPLVATTGGGVELNAAFPIKRLVFNVVQTTRLTTGTASADVLLRSTFVGTSSTVCNAETTIRQYGFAPIGPLCGNTTTYKQAFRYTN
jgi:hypothetical protein